MLAPEIQDTSSQSNYRTSARGEPQDPATEEYEFEGIKHNPILTTIDEHIDKAIKSVLQDAFIDATNP